MIYDLEYFEKMLRLNSVTAEEISTRRWHFLTHHIESLERVLDYGSGVGWFRAWRPPGVTVWSFDIGLYPQTGVPLQTYDLVCFWDVLEHIRDFSELDPVLALSEYVACTVPIVPEEGLREWKHFKPAEHLHYFTEESLAALFDKYGFGKLVVQASMECPPRKDVDSFIFGR